MHVNITVLKLSDLAIYDASYFTAEKPPSYCLKTANATERWRLLFPSLFHSHTKTGIMKEVVELLGARLWAFHCLST